MDATKWVTTSGQPSTKYIRLSLAIMDHGDCYLKVEETSSPMNTATKLQGDSVSLDRLPRAEVLKTAEGNYRIIHSFDPKDELDKLFPVNNDVQFDGINGNLIFKTDKDIRPAALYWCRSKLPIIVSYDTPIVNANGGLLERLDAKNVGRLTINLIRKKEGNTLIGIIWSDRDKDNKLQKENHILLPTEIDLTKEFDKKFRLPVPNSKIDEMFDVSFSSWAGTPKIARLLIQGHLCPMIGIALKDTSSVVFANKVYPGSIGEQAGMKEGDIIVSMNGQEPKSTSEAMDILSHTSLGDELDFKVRRGEIEQEIKFVVR